MDYGVRTIRSERRFFLVEVEQRANASLLTPDNVAKAITAVFVRLFGSEGMNKLDLEVCTQGANIFICSVSYCLGIALRSALTLPPILLSSVPEISGFRVLSEASFLQALLHNSRCDFAPLV
jgi:hypothetical protein